MKNDGFWIGFVTGGIVILGVVLIAIFLILSS